MRRLLVWAALAGAMVMFAQPPPSTDRNRVRTPPATLQIGLAFENQILVLDGLKCAKCTFKNLTLLYSGGQYDLNDATFSGTIAIELHGAAENGLFAVSALSSAKPQPRKLVTFKTPKTMSLKNTW